MSDILAGLLTRLITCLQACLLHQSEPVGFDGRDATSIYFNLWWSMEISHYLHVRGYSWYRVLTGVESDSFAKSVFFQSLIESWEIIETSVED